MVDYEPIIEATKTMETVYEHFPEDHWTIKVRKLVKK